MHWSVPLQNGSLYSFADDHAPEQMVRSAVQTEGIPFVIPVGGSLASSWFFSFIRAATVLQVAVLVDLPWLCVPEVGFRPPQLAGAR